MSATTEEGARLWGAAPTAYLLLLVAMISWSANFIVGRALVGTVGPLTLGWSRWFVASAILLPFTARELWAQRRVLRREWKLMLLLGAIGFAGSNTFCYLALQRTTAVNAGLLNGFGPLMIFAASVLVLRERVALRQLVGIALALLGVAVVVLRGEPRALLALEINLGDVIMLVSICTWCLYSIRLRDRPPELSPVALVAALFTIGLLTMTPFALWEAKIEPTPTVFAAILFVGIFPSVISVLCWNHAIAVIGAARASVFTYLMPLMAALLAMAFLGERMEAFHLVGGGLIFAGLGLGLLRR